MKSKVGAIITCWFLGWIGGHKFYLGETAAGIVYLLFCWTCIPALIAFVEFFVLICMSDNDFNFKYNKLVPQANNRGVAVSAQDATKALADLKNLYDSGVITAEEYEEKRQKLLGYL